MAITRSCHLYPTFSSNFHNINKYANFNDIHLKNYLKWKSFPCLNFKNFDTFENELKFHSLFIRGIQPYLNSFNFFNKKSHVASYGERSSQKSNQNSLKIESSSELSSAILSDEQSIPKSSSNESRSSILNLEKSNKILNPIEGNQFKSENDNLTSKSSPSSPTDSPIDSTIKIAETKSKSEAMPQVRLQSNAELAKSSQSVDDDLGISLAVDLGNHYTGVAISSCGFSPKPIAVVGLKGEKLTNYLLDLAEKENINEIVFGLPLSLNKKENKQSLQCRNFVNFFSPFAFKRGLKVILYDEYNSSQFAHQLMLQRGMNKQDRKEKIDAYAAMVILQLYFEDGGKNAQIIMPRSSKLLKIFIKKSNLNSNLKSNSKSKSNSSEFLDNEEMDDDFWD